MSTPISRLALAASTLALASACVQTRPSRNAVLNEHQYVRKDFLVAPANSTTPDEGWWLSGTITQVSTPNPLGSAAFGLSPGITVGATPMRWSITEDKLEMLNTREMAATDAQSAEVTPNVINAWPSQSVDLMYYVNLDGELTNQYVVNQEAPWQQREWVQLDFDKNDMSDLAPLGEAQWNVLSQCVDVGNVSTTLVPDSFQTYTDPNNYLNNYMQFTVSVTMPLLWTDSNCVYAYGTLGQQAIALGKEAVTMNVMYSMKRMVPMAQNTYKPLVVAEKDSIHHKYGFFPNITENLDPTTGMVGSEEQVERFDPAKPNIWYFAKGFDPGYKHFFTDKDTGIVDQTNKVLATTGSATRVQVREYDDPDGLAPGQGPREYGDIRYSFLVWMNDQFSQETFAGVTTFNVDYRTGEMMTANIAYNIFAFQDYYVQRINDYLLSVGAANDVNNPAEWPTSPTVNDLSLAQNCGPQFTASTGCPITTPTGTTYCANGSTLPIQSVVQAAIANGTSTVFGKMQGYLGLPQSQYGNLSTTDFIAPPSKTNDADFFHAYYAILPYLIYSDPAVNPYTIPEGGNGTFGPPMTDTWGVLKNEVTFQQWAANINAGSQGGVGYTDVSNGWPYQGSTGAAPSILEAAAGADTFRTLGQAHQDYLYNNIWKYGPSQPHLDGMDSLAFENVADNAARMCNGGAWETKEQWVTNITQSYWGQVEYHEFGHSLGLQHNFMGSIDAPNYPTHKLGDNSPNPAACDYTQPGCAIMMHTNSIMEYNAEIDRLRFQNPDWLPYDKGAIAWIYANTTPNGPACTGNTAAGLPCPVSGQSDNMHPWADPMGFDASGNEKQFLFCDEQHMKYTPFCRQGDTGRTPSEIISNEIDSNEWQYQWRNLRQYHKFWDDSAYANGPQALFVALQRFLSLWAFDWSSTELAGTLSRIGITNPDPADQPTEAYLEQLTNKFEAEVSAANQMAAAYHLAMINQAQADRPAASTYDPYYGDVTQQGIILDKYFAMQDFVEMFPVTDYDQNQAAGVYLAWYEGLGDAAFNTLTQWGVVTMLGGVPNVFPYFQPTSVALFAQDTHNPAFGNPPIRNWLGGKEFNREQDFVGYFQDLANQHDYTGAGCVDGTTGAPKACNCFIGADPVTACNYDPRNLVDPNQLNQFVGPDQHRYIWALIPDRNQYVTCEQDTNVVTNQIMLNYNSDVVAGQDDGNFPGGAFGYELPIKYTADSFIYYN